MGESLQALAAQGVVDPENQSTILPPKFVQWAHRDRGNDRLLPEPIIDVLKGQDLGKRRGMRGKLGQVIQRAAYAKFTDALNALPAVGRPPGPDDPCGKLELRRMARVCQRSLTGNSAWHT